MQQNTSSPDVSQNPQAFQNFNESTTSSIYNYFSNFSETTFKSLMPHLWVLLLTLFFIALPLIAYLAYKHGKRTATTAIPQAVRDAYYYFGPSAQRTQKISPDSSFEMSYRSASCQSKNSSTNSSPALGPAQRSRNNSLTNRIISPDLAPMIEKRESSVQTQEEDFEEMNLEGFDSEQVASSSLTNFQNKEKPSPKVFCQGTSTNHDDLIETDIVLKNKTSQITINSNGRKSQSLEKENSSSFITEKLQRLQEEQTFETIIQKYGLPHETGKFQKIFQSLEWIGEGSFGQVQKVVHCLDGRVYAVKKVRVNLEKFEHLKTKSKVFREVFAMTDLHHPNIVRYFTCWIEIETIMKENIYNKNQQLQHISESENSDNEEEDNDSCEESKPEDVSSNSNMGFEWDVSSKNIQKLPKSLHIKKPKKPSHPKSEKFLLQSFSKTFVEDSENVSSSSCQNDPQSNQDFKLYLYIQMEYCSGQSLKYFLDNPQRILDHKTSICMFKKILEGVKAIHSKGIIHRDLKPANIFLDGEGNVKIGDFGLALLNKTDEPSSKSVEGVGLSLNRVHSMKVGTPMYTSPEQEAGGHYDERTDIYSLGLIFYEMLVSFSTGHERHYHFNMIKHEHKLPETFIKNFEKESLLILNMTCKEPQSRPTLDELLKKL